MSINITIDNVEVTVRVQRGQIVTINDISVDYFTKEFILKVYDEVL